MSAARRREGIALFCLALFLRVGVSIWGFSRVPPTADGKFYHVVAQRIANGDGYTWLWPDGTVTFAAHYPVGYPALMAVPYALVGPHPGAMMLVNALLGALAVWGCHRICLETLTPSFSEELARRAALGAGGILALSPTLLGYTPALMTEGAVGAFLVFATCGTLWVRQSGSKRSRLLGRLAVAILLGIATLLRPQSVLFAPVLGALSIRGAWGRRVLGAALVSLGCLSVVLPWTARNCAKMERCVFVSANGGWNLLIGTFAEGHGAWVALDGDRVPVRCREVFQEAEKDKCFGRAGVERIVARPARWLSLVPEKLRATLDYTAAAADHLVEAGALSADRKEWLSFPEFAFQRLAAALGLFGIWAEVGGRRRWPTRRGEWGLLTVLLVGLAGFSGAGAGFGWGACLALSFCAPRLLDRAGYGVAAFAVLATLAVHAVFFGAGRYALPLIYLTAPWTALGIGAFLRGLGYGSTSREV